MSAKKQYETVLIPWLSIIPGNGSNILRLSILSAGITVPGGYLYKYLYNDMVYVLTQTHLNEANKRQFMRLTDEFVMINKSLIGKYMV